MKPIPFDNLKHFTEIVLYVDENPEDYYEIEAPQFISNIFVVEIWYPEWVKNWENKDQLLEMVQTKDLMQPIEKMIRNSGLDLIPKKEIDNGSNYYYVHISFALKPLSQHKGLLNRDSLNIFLIPYENEMREIQVKIMSSRLAFLGHFYLLENAELLNPSSNDELDKYYLEKISEAVELICNEFKIETENNKGRFTETIKEDDEKLLDEFIEITHANDFQEKNEIVRFKKNIKMIRDKPEVYLERCIKNGSLDEDCEIDVIDFYQGLLGEFLFSYQDDWKIDHEELSAYISEEIGQDFNITYEETGQRPEVIARKLEKESDFTLLNIDTQMDSYSFFLCEKSDKDKILELARKLHFPIEDY